MKIKNLLFTCLLTSAITGVDFALHIFPGWGKPASIFQGVIPQISEEIPANWQMRLPAYLPPETPKLYPYIESDSSRLVVYLGITPDCKSQVHSSTCTIAAIGNFTGEMKGNFPPKMNNSKTISLAQNIRGYHFTQGEGEGLTRFVFWQQNQQVYGIGSLFINEQEIQKVANSMIEQPPIRKK